MIAIPMAVFAAPGGKAVGGGSYIEWQLSGGGYEKVILTVSQPDGEVFTREYAAGGAVSLSLKDLPSAGDGNYSYQLLFVPKVSAAVQAQLSKARDAGNDAAARALLRAAGLSEQNMISGSFLIANGSIVSPDRLEEGPGGGTLTANSVREEGPKAGGTAAPARPGTPVVNDQVIPDDLIVQGSTCVGFDCVNNESFGFDTIRLKENSTRIKFEDTSVGSFPSNDWQLTANDSASGGANKFSIEDITGSKVPFTITAGASTNSIFVDSTGRLGLRTSTPVLDLHISTSNTPAIRLEQTNAGGFTAQTWDIAGNEANFFVRDVTGGSKLPFRIRPGAPTSSVDISADGDVGIGTASPNFKLHVFGSTSDDTVMTIGNDGAGSPGAAFNVGYGAASFGAGVGFLNAKGTVSGVNPSIRMLTNGTTQMIVTQSGAVGIGTTAPSSKLHVNGGDIRVSGGSFIDDGVTLNVPDYVFEPGYALMPLDKLETFVKENRHLPGIPSATEVKSNGLNLSQMQVKLLEKVEELTLHVLAQQKQMDELRAANTALASQLAKVSGPTNQ
jgi:hypothetical protein